MATRTVAIVIAAAILIGVGASAWAQPGAASDRLQWWREARFGLFIHWGPVSLKGTEIGWSRGGERRGTGGAPGPIPVEVYDNLYRQFNPTKFNAREWVAIAKQAGMKYLVFTTRHHDGFSMFDSAVTDYKITNSPFQRDVVAELAEACHEAGIRLGFYYSPPDWHHPDYRTENHARFIEFLHAQARELCTKYGKLDIFWFDGLGGTPKDWDSERLIKMIRELQPEIIINNRAGLPEDYDTPEQVIGRFQKDRPWETCMTICQQWAWKPDDVMKSGTQCIEILVRCAGGDGNLLLNVGPMPTGEIEPRQVKQLEEVGAWLQRYGETIYGTRGGPFLPGEWGASTYRGNTIFVHVLSWDTVGKRLLLPPIAPRVVRASLVSGGEVKCRQTEKGIAVSVRPSSRQTPDTVVALELDGPADGIAPVAVTSVDRTAPGKARASNVHQNDPTYAADKAIDGNESSRWATDAGTHQAWLEFRLKKPARVGFVSIKEACGERVQRFDLECKSRGTWKSILSGKKIGESFRAAFAAVKAQDFRLNIREATEGPTIWEIRLEPPKKK